MSSPIKELFENDDYSRAELNRCIEAKGKSIFFMNDAADRTLSFIVLYASPSIAKDAKDALSYEYGSIRHKKDAIEQRNINNEVWPEQDAIEFLHLEQLLEQQP